MSDGSPLGKRRWAIAEGYIPAWSHGPAPEMVSHEAVCFLNVLNGLYDAKLDGQPVLAITGNAFHDLIDTYQQQDVNLDRLFTDVAVYSTRVMGSAHVANITSLAARIALSYRGVAHINVPTDIQEQTHDERSERNVPHHTDEVFGDSARVPSRAGLERAAGILNAGKKVAILAGRGALGATDELIETAERLGAPIIKALLGKACVPDDCAYTTGGIGLLGTRPSEEALEDCDTLLMVGTSFSYMEFYPKPGKARAIQIDIDPARIGLRYPVEVGLVGDARPTLAELLPLLSRSEDRGFLEKAQKGMKDWWKLMEERSTRMDKPMKPQFIARELGRRLEPTAIVSSDSGAIATIPPPRVLPRPRADRADALRRSAGADGRLPGSRPLAPRARARVQEGRRRTLCALKPLFPMGPTPCAVSCERRPEP